MRLLARTTPLYAALLILGAAGCASPRVVLEPGQITQAESTTRELTLTSDDPGLYLVVRGSGVQTRPGITVRIGGVAAEVLGVEESALRVRATETLATGSHEVVIHAGGRRVVASPALLVVAAGDASVMDAGPGDGGVLDVGQTDLGVEDLGPADQGVADLGQTDLGGPAVDCSGLDNVVACFPFDGDSLDDVSDSMLTLGVMNTVFAARAGGVALGRFPNARAATTSAVSASSTTYTIATWFTNPLVLDGQESLVTADTIGISLNDNMGARDVVCWGGGVRVSAAFTAGTLGWKHAVCVFDTDAVRLYVDGVEVAREAPMSAYGAVSDLLFLGQFNAAGDDAFVGSLDEVIFTTDVLSADEACALSGGTPPCM